LKSHSEMLENPIPKPPHVVRIHRRNRDGPWRYHSCEVAAPGSCDQVRLIEHHHARLILQLQFSQHLLGDFVLFSRLGRTAIDDMYKQVGIPKLLERGPKGRHQRVRQIADESHRVDGHHGRVTVGIQRTHAGIEGGKKFVLGKDPRMSQRIQQGGFSGVGITDNGDLKHFAPSVAPHLTLPLDFLEAIGQHLHPLAHEAPIDLDLLFAHAFIVEAAALPLEMGPEMSQAGQKIFQSREFHLDLGLFGTRMSGKNFDDHSRPINRGLAQELFHVLELIGSEVEIKHHGVDFGREQKLLHLFQLSTPHVGGGVDLAKGHFDARGGLDPERSEKTIKFIQGLTALPQGENLEWSVGIGGSRQQGLIRIQHGESRVLALWEKGFEWKINLKAHEPETPKNARGKKLQNLRRQMKITPADILVNIDGKIQGSPGHGLASLEDPKISVFDRSYLYGDSLYEVVRTYDGIPTFMKEHLDRLALSGRLCHMELEPLLPVFEREMIRTVAEFRKLPGKHDTEAYCRIVVSRGVGRIGFALNCLESPIRFTIIAQPLNPPDEQAFEKGAALSVVKRVRNSPKALDPAMKSGNYLNSLLAFLEAHEAGFDDALLADAQGFMTEGTTFNLFYVKRGIVVTSPLEVGILDGITRKHVIELARKHGIPVREVRYPPSRLQEADEVFLSSTIKEVFPITRIDRTRIGKGLPGPVTRRLKALFDAEVPRWKARDEQRQKQLILGATP
jgi:branched-chain amino acid aminotransferase